MPKQGEAVTITQCETLPRIRVTLAEIQEVKRVHILENLCYSAEEVGALFGKSSRWALDRLKEGKFIAVDDNAKKNKHGALQPSQGVRFTAISVQRFKREYEIAPDEWIE